MAKKTKALEESGLSQRRQAAKRAGKADYTVRKDMLIQAAATVFAKKGYDSATLSDVAAEMSVDRASLYYYVSNKQDLFDLVAIRPVEANVEKLEAVLASDIAPDAKLRLAIVSLMESFADHYPSLYVYIREDDRGALAGKGKRATRVGGLSTRYDNAFVGIVDEAQLRGLLDSPLPPRVIANGIIGMLAWTHRWFRPGGVLSANAIGSGFADMVLNGLLTPQERTPSQRAPKAKAAAPPEPRVAGRKA